MLPHNGNHLEGLQYGPGSPPENTSVALGVNGQEQTAGSLPWEHTDGQDTYGVGRSGFGVGS